MVVDSGSTDATVAIARQAGARVFERPFEGFRSQKQFAVEQARFDWVLCLDADERVADFWVRAAHLESLHPHDASAWSAPQAATHD